MPETKEPRTPSYRRHKASGQAVVTIDGQDLYLGKYGTKASRQAYDRRISEWLANGRTLPSANGDLSIAELILAYWRHVSAYYRKDGEPTSELNKVRCAMRPLKRLYGREPASMFGPLALKAVRQQMVASGLARMTVNAQVQVIKRMFKWATENELVLPSVYHSLQAFCGLRRGRSEARETQPVQPVPDEFVDAVRPHVSGQVWAMIELQRLAGLRPGEVVVMRASDIDMTGSIWHYRPGSHETEHHGHSRVIELGPRAQQVIRRFLKPELDAFRFSPADAEAERAISALLVMGVPALQSTAAAASSALTCLGLASFLACGFFAVFATSAAFPSFATTAATASFASALVTFVFLALLAIARSLAVMPSDTFARSSRRRAFSWSAFAIAASFFLLVFAGPRRRWALLMWMRLPVAVFVAFQSCRLWTLSMRTWTSLSLTFAAYVWPIFTSLFFMSSLLQTASCPVRPGRWRPVGRSRSGR